MRNIGLDTETHLIKPGCVAPKLVCVSTDDGSGPRLFDRKDGLVEARRILKEDNMIGHWIFFDLCVMAVEEPDLLPLIFKAIEEGRVHCTKVRQMIIDNAEGKLKFIWNEETNEYKKQSYHLWRLLQRHFGRDVKDKKEADNAWRLRYGELDGIPLSLWPPEAIEYALDDATDPLKLFESQEAYCAPHGLPAAPDGETSQTKAAWGLYLMGAWGVRTDPKAVAKLKEEVTAEYRAAVETAQRYKLVRKGKKESRDMAAIRAAVEKWYSEHERPMKWTSGGKKGQPQISTDREQLTDVECPCGSSFKAHKALEDTDKECTIDGIHRGLWAVAEVVRLSKLLSTYIKALERGTIVPINPSYNPIIETFRTSCSQGMKIDGVPMGTNLQNPPRKHGVRECFIPRFPHWLFMFCDYDTLEMLTLAQVCIELFGFSCIADAAWAGEDFHLSFAADMLGISYKEAEERLKNGDPVIIETRQFCKIGNYGFAGGMGWSTFIQYAKGFGTIVTPPTAKRLHSAFREKWKEMPQYFRFVSNLIGDGNRVKVVTFPKSGLMRGRVTYTATCNGFFQHRAAMGAKAAVWAVSKESYVDHGTALYGCRPWLFAHDEIGAEVPYSGKRASDAAGRLEKVMVDEMKSWCPDVPIAASAVLTRRWYKGAKPVYINGVMVPSRPEKKKWVADL